MAKIIVANDHPEQTRVMAEAGVGSTVPWSEQAFADEILYILANPEAARERAANGPDYVRKHRAYDVIAAQVNRIYLERILGER